MKVNPKKIITLEGTYPRSKEPTEEAQVAHLMGVNFPNITTANKGTNLVDGAHRRLACILSGVKEITVEDLGTMNADQILRESIVRNSTHGKQLSLTEKCRLAKRLEGSMKQKEMARVFAVSERTVNRWVEEVKETRRISQTKRALKLIDKGSSVNATAKELKVSTSTLQGWLKAAKDDPTFVVPKKAKKKAEAKAEASAPLTPQGGNADLESDIDEIVIVAYKAIKAAAKAHDQSVEDVGFEVIKLINERL